MNEELNDMVSGLEKGTQVGCRSNGLEGSSWLRTLEPGYLVKNPSFGLCHAYNPRSALEEATDVSTGPETPTTAGRNFPGSSPSLAELWSPASSPADGFPVGGMSTNVHQEGPAHSRLLEDIRRRLVRAFQRVAPREGSRRAREAAATAATAAAAAAAAEAQEEQGRARVESALAGLRAELLEMHFQNRQLARMLLDLNMKMQQLKKEYELEIASESQSLEDNAVNLE
ncbi:alanine and arginine-rich domain-containing protein [Choloepus didactylus]|uniref:alanine and arginine-rich domain-containing protein n=1 Tax=Choloepus didactylus TaxID=27675 RepID=UPI00189EBA44|nr:alanine and arginine-rich domain-containing protein [Choloepus didactylus]